MSVPAFLISLVLITTSSAQTPGREQSYVGIVHDALGKALGGARVSLHSPPPSDYSWLNAILPPPQPVSGSSDSRGRFKLMSTAKRATLWIEHDNGFGALIHGMHPGIAAVLATEALGELQLESSKPFRAKVRALLADGESIYLGSQQGEQISLPTGAYLLLIDYQAHVYELRIRIRSGERSSIVLPAKMTQEILGWNDMEGTVYLDGWPLALPESQRRLPLPQPSARGLLRWHRPIHGTTWFQHQRYRAGANAELPLRKLRHRRFKALDMSDQPVSGVRICVLSRDVARVRILSMALTDAQGRADIASPQEDDDTLIIAISAGHSPKVLPPAPADSVAIFRLTPDHHANLRILDPRGRPLAGVRVQSWQEPKDVLHRVIDSNVRGEITLDDLHAGSMQLQITHPDYLITKLTLTPRESPDQPFTTIQLKAGLALQGQIIDITNRSVPGAVIELRWIDASGRELRKTVASDAKGMFRIRGLPDNRFTLFCTNEVDGITWSGRITQVAPDETDLAILIRPEDPPLPRKR